MDAGTEIAALTPTGAEGPGPAHWPATTSEFSGRPGDVEDGFDAGSQEALGRALRSIAGVGWDSVAGRAVLGALQLRAGSWACLVDRRCGRPPGSTDPLDVVTVAWLTLESLPARAADVQRPWAYLWTAVGNEFVRAAIAESLLMDVARVRTTSVRASGVLRVGLETETLSTAGSLPAEDSGGAHDEPSAAVVELARRLSVDHSDVAFWLDAIGRALDVMADARRSYEEYRLRRDTYMLEVLGLGLDELSALSALLIGPRTGDRAAHSLLLALRRDLSVPTASVVGASARVSLLRSHRAAGTVSTAA